MRCPIPSTPQRVGQVDCDLPTPDQPDSSLHILMTVLLLTDSVQEIMNKSLNNWLIFIKKKHPRKKFWLSRNLLEMLHSWGADSEDKSKKTTICSHHPLPTLLLSLQCWDWIASLLGIHGWSLLPLDDYMVFVDPTDEQQTTSNNWHLQYHSLFKNKKAPCLHYACIAAV